MANPTYQQVHIDGPLTNVSVAYTPGNYIWDQVFPRVPVQKISDKYFGYTKGDFLRREAQLRAPGARAARAGYGLSSSMYTCLEIALAHGVPDEIQDNADSPLNPLEDGTRFLTEQVFLQMESDVAGQAFGNSIWSSSATPGTLWNNDTADPLADFETAACAIVGSIGRLPNTGVLGYETWARLKNHPDIVERIKYAAGPTSPAIVTQAAAATLFGLEKLLIGVAIENTGKEGAADSLAFVWGKHALVAYVAPRASLMTPSAGYVFTYKDRAVERFREDQEHQWVISLRWNYDVKVVAPDAGYLFKSAVT